MSKTDTGEIKEKDDRRKGRNPSAKAAQDKNSENKIAGAIKISTQFLSDCKMELKRVKWPTRKELFASTTMVIFLVIVIAAVLGVADALLVEIIKKLAL